MVERVGALNLLVGDYYIYEKPDTALGLAEMQYMAAKRINHTSYMGDALNSKGIALAQMGNFDLALEQFLKVVELRKAHDQIEKMGMAYNNVGRVYSFKGDYLKAIDAYSESIAIAEKFDDREGIGVACANIGNLYADLGNYEKALVYYERGLKIHRERNDAKGISRALNNIGIVHEKYNQPEQALDKYEESLKIKRKLNDTRGMAATYSNIGFVHQNAYQDYDKAILFFKRSDSLSVQDKDDRERVNTLAKLGDAYGLKGDVEQGIECSGLSLQLAQKLGALRGVRFASFSLYRLYQQKKDYEKSLEMHILYKNTIDSIRLKEASEKLIQREYEIRYKQKVAADSTKNAEAQKVKDAELVAQKAIAGRQKLLSYFLYAGLLIALVFGVFVFNRFRVTNRQKKVIELQNTEIVDSITYAKRIQNAILPPKAKVSKLLPDAFVLYRPKDIVAGDFYWMQELNNIVLFAVADCTGHGVPGAMVSVVCNNSLNRAVREYGLTEPGQILDKTRDTVLEEFGKSEDEVNDGMDIALCAIQGNRLSFAGANNPLWIIRDGGKEVEEIKGDKQPIGRFVTPKPYRTHTVELMPGDSVYIFSDGFADQFGGARGKKYKSGRLKKTLLGIQSVTMQEQRVKLNEEFEQWRGSLEQLDDICIIGYKHQG